MRLVSLTQRPLCQRKEGTKRRSFLSRITSDILQVLNRSKYHGSNHGNHYNRNCPVRGKERTGTMKRKKAQFIQEVETTETYLLTLEKGLIKAIKDNANMFFKRAFYRLSKKSESSISMNLITLSQNGKTEKWIDIEITIKD